MVSDSVVSFSDKTSLLKDDAVVLFPGVYRNPRDSREDVPLYDSK